MSELAVGDQEEDADNEEDLDVEEVPVPAASLAQVSASKVSAGLAKQSAAGANRAFAAGNSCSRDRKTGLN